jgi:hypothetical protein
MRFSFDPPPDGEPAVPSVVATLMARFKDMSPRQLAAWVDGAQRYEEAGKPHGDTAAGMLAWLEDQPGGFPDPDTAR